MIAYRRSGHSTECRSKSPWNVKLLTLKKLVPGTGAVDVCNELACALDLDLPSTLVFDYPTMTSIAAHIAAIQELSLAQTHFPSPEDRKTAWTFSDMQTLDNEVHGGAAMANASEEDMHMERALQGPEVNREGLRGWLSRCMRHCLCCSTRKNLQAENRPYLYFLEREPIGVHRSCTVLIM